MTASDNHAVLDSENILPWKMEGLPADPSSLSVTRRRKPVLRSCQPVPSETRGGACGVFDRRMQCNRSSVFRKTETRTVSSRVEENETNGTRRTRNDCGQTKSLTSKSANVLSRLIDLLVSNDSRTLGLLEFEAIWQQVKSLARGAWNHWEEHQHRCRKHLGTPSEGCQLTT